MALTPLAITLALQAAGPEFLGPTFGPLSIAIGQAVHTWAILPTNLALTGVTTGAAPGMGIVTGLVTVPPNPLLAASMFTANGVVGPTGVSLARALGVGIPAAFTAGAQYVGTSIGVSVGTDLSKISIVNPATLNLQLLPLMQANFGGVLGLSAAQVALAITNAVTSLLAAGFTTPLTGIVTPVPPPSPLPAQVIGTSPLSAVF